MPSYWTALPSARTPPWPPRASPTGAEAFVLTESALTIGGAGVTVKGGSIKDNNALAVESRILGTQTKEPLASGEATIEGDPECEFEDLAIHAA